MGACVAIDQGWRRTRGTRGTASYSRPAVRQQVEWIDAAYDVPHLFLGEGGLDGSDLNVMLGTLRSTGRYVPKYSWTGDSFQQAESWRVCSRLPLVRLVNEGFG